MSLVHKFSFSFARSGEPAGSIHVWLGPLGVNTHEVTMSAATMTRTNRTLYPDIFVVVDSRRGCGSCD